MKKKVTSGRFIEINHLSKSEASLLVANIFLLFLVFIGKINPFHLIFIYWAETGIIGFFKILQMLVYSFYRIGSTGRFTRGVIEPNIKNPLIKSGLRVIGLIFNLAGIAFLTIFFCVHFGGFMTGHLIFLLFMFGSNVGLVQPDFSSIIILFQSVGFEILILFFSHLVSFQTNFIKVGRFYKNDPGSVMMGAYGRVMLMHILIIFVGGASIIIGETGGIIFATILVVIKTFADLYSHKKEHKKNS